MQIGELLTHILKLVLGEAACLIAMRAVLQFQQFPHFLQAETQSLLPGVNYSERSASIILSGAVGG